MSVKLKFIQHGYFKQTSTRITFYFDCFWFFIELHRFFIRLFNVFRSLRKLNNHLFGKELFIRFIASAFRKLLSVYVFSYFPLGFEGRMWDRIISVPDHCLSFYFIYDNWCVSDHFWYWINTFIFISLVLPPYTEIVFRFVSIIIWNITVKKLPVYQSDFRVSVPCVFPV